MSTIKGLPGFTLPYPCTDKNRSSSIHFLYLHYPGSLYKSVALILFRKSHYFYVKANAISPELETRPSEESAKLRAMRGEIVPMSLAFLRAHVPTCLEYLRASRVNMPYVHMY